MLRRLAARFPVAVLSGRPRDQVAALVGLPEVAYAGSHGFEISGPPPFPGAPPLVLQVGAELHDRISLAASRLGEALAGLPGVLIEPKGAAVAVHYRLARSADLPAVEGAVASTLGDFPDLRLSSGKMVFELRPTLAWDKGRALEWLLARHDPSNGPLVPIAIGDDVTDEDAFAAVAGRGVAVLVGGQATPIAGSGPVRQTAAAYLLRDPTEVRRFLELAAGGD